MKKITSHILDNFEAAVDNLTELCIIKYFRGVDTDHYWISSDRTGVLVVNDYYFSLEIVVDAIKINATPRMLFDYYDLSLDKSMKDEPIGINFKNFCLYTELRSKR